ncbi:probable protein phosphatase 2C 24 [Cornus florida]|uniref:probable protein phosphatase 2C 24 n=1 Tax=Cornus florida TaxID=4283 RepID=UPI00289863C4|nr:probable protein phosphatase 2C 24 [Cornus florida]
MGQDKSYDVASDNKKSPPCESSQPAEMRHRRIEIRHSRFVENEQKRQKLEPSPSPSSSSSSSSLSLDSEDSVDSCYDYVSDSDSEDSETREISVSNQPPIMLTHEPVESRMLQPKFGFISVCGRRRYMEDTVAVHPSLFRNEDGPLHYFGVYDGHGCSHVAIKCMDRLHEVVKEELESSGGGLADWVRAIHRSFFRMDREVSTIRHDDVSRTWYCGCGLKPPMCYFVGSTALVAVLTPTKIIIANCGDSRAVICQDGNVFPLSIDQKPNRPDERRRIEAAGGKVISDDGCPRVQGILAMSRALGDNYLKPFVICQPELTVIDRTTMDDFLILASDGLWDVLSNENARDVVRDCWAGGRAAEITTATSIYWPESRLFSDRLCWEASALLVMAALAKGTADNVSALVINLKENT